MKTHFLPWILVGLLAACGGETDQIPSASSHTQAASNLNGSTLTAAVYLKNKAAVPYQINEKGIVQFSNPKDMFSEFGDYNNDKLKFNSPTNFRISDYLPAQASNDDIRISTNKAFMYAVYKTFTYTKVERVTVESVPIDMDTLKPLSNKPLKATVSRERALEVLKKYSSAQSFDDLIEQKPNNQSRIIGLSASTIYDEFAYNLDHQDAVIRDLTTAGVP